MRVTGWVLRFIGNCRSRKREHINGPLTAKEINDHTVLFWIKRVQFRHESTENFKDDQQQLGLQKNENGVYVCHDRIQGEYPVYLPPSALFSKRLVMNAHLSTLDGRVGLTMAAIREDYWIPRLQQVARKVIKTCNRCKRFHATPYSKPKPGYLPRDRTEGSRPFKVVGVDYAGPIKYVTKKKKEAKTYILLFACSLTQAVYIELLPDQTVDQFVPCLSQKSVARRGRLNNIYSDNAKTFTATAKWIRGIMKDEKLNEFLVNQGIVWQFNLSRTPWWGEQFERIIGLSKQAMYNVIGNARLKLNELEEMLLDVEITLNNRPLSYVEDDV